MNAEEEWILKAEITLYQSIARKKCLPLILSFLLKGKEFIAILLTSSGAKIKQRQCWMFVVLVPQSTNFIEAN